MVQPPSPPNRQCFLCQVCRTSSQAQQFDPIAWACVKSLPRREGLIFFAYSCFACEASGTLLAMELLAFAWQVLCGMNNEASCIEQLVGLGISRHVAEKALQIFDATADNRMDKAAAWAMSSQPRRKIPRVFSPLDIDEPSNERCARSLLSEFEAAAEAGRATMFWKKVHRQSIQIQII